MLITICLLILVYSILGKDIKPFLKKIEQVDWRGHCDNAWSLIKDYSKKAGRLACEPLLKLWYVLDDPSTSVWDKAIIYAAIIYTISPISLLPAYLYRLLGLLDEGVAIFYVIKKVDNKMTPAIENKVKDILEEWFGPEYSVRDAKS